VCQRYVSLKEKNLYLKKGLETAENLTQPVLKKLDDTLHLDDKGVAILDKIENTAHGISSTASGMTYSILNTANRPVNYLLDYSESILDHILPPHQEPIIPIEIDTEDDDDSFAESTEADNQNNISITVENPIMRIKRITGSVPQRLADKLVPLQEETVGYVTEMLKFAYESVDVEGRKSLIYENAAVVHRKLDEKREDIVKLVSPAKEILERHTADIKDKSVKALVMTVAAITHVAEILRRQLVGTVIDPAKLHDHLNQVTKMTKNAISKLKEHELANYIQKFKGTSLVTIQALIDLTYAHTPERLLPLLNQLSRMTYPKHQSAQSEEEPITNST